MVDRRAFEEARARRGIGGLLLFALVLIAALISTSVPQAIDAALQTGYYRVSPPTTTEQGVLLVEADDDTLAAWGEPRWSRERERALLERIAEGSPAAIVVLDGSRMFQPVTAPGQRTGEPSRIDLTTHIDPGSRAIESLGGDELPLQPLLPVLEALGVPEPRSERLWIHYTWPPTRMPVVEFHRIEQGDVPASVFTGKLVVVGLTSLAHRDLVATPVGALTSPEIISHALAMLIDGRRWYEPSLMLRALGLVLVLAVAGLVLRGTAPAQALVRASVLAAVLLLADLLAFSQGVARWGVATELIAVLSMVIGHWYASQRRSAVIVETVSEHITEHLEIEPVAATDDAFWKGMAEHVGAYLKVEFIGVIAELPAGSWHLRRRAFIGMTEQDIHERRLDVRRPPYRAGFLTHRASRSERRFTVDEERWTLAAPLTYQGILYGVWMICVKAGVELDEAEMTVIRDLSTELGRSIASARRGQRQDMQVAASSGDVTQHLSRLVQGVDALGEDKRQVVDTFEVLPMGVLVADVWGHIVRINGAMRLQLAALLSSGIPSNDLCGVLAHITGRSLPGVHEIMRAVVRSGETFRLRSTQNDGRATSYLLMSMRRDTTGDSLVQGDPTTHLMLMVVPDPHEPAVDVLSWSA